MATKWKVTRLAFIALRVMCSLLKTISLAKARSAVTTGIDTTVQ